jgi:hypothetical protein
MKTSLQCYFEPRHRGFRVMGGCFTGRVLALSASAPSRAQTASWTNLDGGSWANAANWPGGVIASGTNITPDISQLALRTNVTVTMAAPFWSASRSLSAI